MRMLSAHPRYLSLADPALLALVLQRDERAFAELVRRHRGLIFRCIARVLSRYARLLGSECMEDVFAETCVLLWADDLRRLRAYDATRGMKLSSWLGLIANHAAFDHLRRLQRRALREDDHPVEMEEERTHEPDALDHLLADERRAQVDSLTRVLSARDRQFMAHYYDADEEPEDVARALGISVKTVYSKKHKIVTRLLKQAAEDLVAA